MASQDTRLFKFESDFKQQQSEMTNKIDTVLKAITDRITGALPSDTVKNPKLNVNSTSLLLSSRSYPTVDPQCSTQIYGSINTITICPKLLGESQTGKPEEEEQDEKDSPKNINTNPSSPPDPLISFITKKIRKLSSFFELLGLKSDDSQKEEPEVGENAGVRELEVEYFNVFPTRRNFTYVIDFMIVEDISSIIDPRLLQVVLGKPFVEISNMNHDPPEGVVSFTNGTDEIAYKMPHKIEQYNSLSDLEREHTKSVYLRNEEDNAIEKPIALSTRKSQVRGILTRYFSFGRNLEELYVAWAHLEKKRTRLRTNTKTLEDLCSQSLEMASQAIHDAVTTHQVTTSQHFMMASARTDLNTDLEDSTYDGVTTKMRCRRFVFLIYTNPNLEF
ncbi:hypothetical protein Tco_1113431 [Tanacetum coccineum]|uniref:MAK10-like protein n=1 Tax=Tanacetum coccineum TaxID=301880 RepID=A0ABQ5IV51_9ASTR